MSLEATIQATPGIPPSVKRKWVSSARGGQVTEADWAKFIAGAKKKQNSANESAKPAPQAEPKEFCSPLHIEIGIFYHCMSSGDFNRMDDPAVKDALSSMTDAGLLVYTPDGGRKYHSTEGLKIWVKRLCGVPFPQQEWR